MRTDLRKLLLIQILKPASITIIRTIEIFLVFVKKKNTAIKQMEHEE